MAYVYVHIDAEFTCKRDDAVEYCNKINSNGTLSVTLHQERYPLAYYSLYFSLSSCLKGGRLQASVIKNDLIQVEIAGNYKVSIKKQYIDIALSPETLWLLSSDKINIPNVLCGVRKVEFENYYGKQSYYCFDVIVKKKANELPVLSKITATHDINSKPLL